MSVEILCYHTVLWRGRQTHETYMQINNVTPVTEPCVSKNEVHTLNWLIMTVVFILLVNFITFHMCLKWQ